MTEITLTSIYLAQIFKEILKMLWGALLFLARNILMLPTLITVVITLLSAPITILFRNWHGLFNVSYNLLVWGVIYLTAVNITTQTTWTNLFPLLITACIFYLLFVVTSFIYFPDLATTIIHHLLGTPRMENRK